MSEDRSFSFFVTPAKAGVQSSRFLDPRLRGDDAYIIVTGGGH